MHLKYGQSRADGYKFMRYYKRRGKMYEEWASPERFIRSPRRKIDPSKNVKEEIQSLSSKDVGFYKTLFPDARRLVYAAIMRGEISFK